MPKLYHFTLCPFSRRIRLALGEYGAAAELVEEKPWALTRGFLKLSPTGSLPAFVEDDRSAVSGIAAVSEYLEETRVGHEDAVSLLGDTPLERASLTTADRALPAGTYALENLLGGPEGARLRVSGGGTFRGYVPLAALAPRQAYVFDLVPRAGR